MTPQRDDATDAAHVTPRELRADRADAVPRADRADTAKRVVVIGGGITGLATAGLLAREGHHVTLLEKQPSVGGRAGSLESGGFRFDTGPSWYLMPEVFDHFFRLMGSSAEEELELVKLEPGYSVRFEGHAEPITITSDRDANIALFERLDPGSGRRLAKHLDSAADTYEMAKRRFLYSTFQSLRPLFAGDVLARLPKLARLLLRSLDRHAASVTRDARLQQILGYPAVFLGSSPFDTPSMYHLMSHLDMTDGVYYPMGGFARVIERIAALATDAGAEIRTSTPVERILVEDGRAVGVQVLSGAAQGADPANDPAGERRVETIPADLVVSTADLHHSETALLDPEHQTYPADYWEKRVAGPGALLLYLGVRGELPELDHHTLLFASDWRANFDAIFGAETRIPDTASLYICKPSGIDPDVAPPGHSNVFVLVPLPADPDLFAPNPVSNPASNPAELRQEPLETRGEGALGATRHGGGPDAAGQGRAVDVEELGDRIIRQISEWAGIPDLADRIVVRHTRTPADFAADMNVWKGSALGPAHTLKQSAFFRGANVSKKVDGLIFAGSSTIPGIGLPMCLISAELVLKRMRGDTSTEPLPEPSRAEVKA